MQATLEQIKLYTSLWRETNYLYEDWAKQHSLSYYELLVMLSLSEAEGPCKQKEICHQWQLPKQTVNTILKHFSEHAWVTLIPSQEDRRNKDILLTESGQNFIHKITGELHTHECAVWNALGTKRAKAFIDITALYNRLFKEAGTHEPK